MIHTKHIEGLFGSRGFKTAKKSKIKNLHQSRFYTSDIASNQARLNVLKNPGLTTLGSHEGAMFKGHMGPDRAYITLSNPLNKLDDDSIEYLESLSEVAEYMSQLYIENTGKVFCSGLDLELVYDCLLNYPEDTLGLYKSIYSSTLRFENRKINGFAGLNIIDGAVLGSGLGLAMSNDIRIATENSILALRDPRNGFFCDNGATYYLPRLNYHIGYYLALTGNTLKGIDLKKAGIATHYIPSQYLESALQKVVENGKINEMKDVLTLFEEDDGTATFCDLYGGYIEETFRAVSMDHLTENLSKHQLNFARTTRASFKKSNPTSLKVTLESLRRGAKKNIEECLNMEYGLAQHFLKDKNFKEGLRANVIDKDKKPKWDPKGLSNVTQEMVQGYFNRDGLESL